MPTIERTEEYDATPEKLWAVVADLPRWPTWLTLMKEWTTEPPRELVAGTRLDGLISIMNIPMSVSWSVDRCEPPTVMEISGVAVLNSQVSLTATISPQDQGSRVDLAIAITNPMLVGALADSLVGAVRRDVDQSFANFQQLLVTDN